MNTYKSKVTAELVKCAKFLYTDAGRTSIEALVGEGNAVFSKHRHPSSVASATITLPERKITMTEGDWLIKGDTFSVCSNDVFQQLYATVEAVAAVEVVVEVEAAAEPVAEVEAPAPVQAVEVVEVEAPAVEVAKPAKPVKKKSLAKELAETVVHFGTKSFKK